MGMTQDPIQGGLSNEKVAELEHKLADAAAEVARVQAQLSQAQGAGQPPPPAGMPLSTMPPVAGAGAPGSTIPSAPPAVPYGGATSPHVITINGQQVVPGSGNMLQVLSQLGQSGGVPVVMVNGQQVSGGQVADISKYLTPEVTQRIQSSLQSLGLDHGLGAMFGGAGALGSPPAAPELVAPLAEPPRHVPLAYRLATFNLIGAELFILLMGFVAPIAVWMFAPIAIPGALIVAVVGIVWFRGRIYLARTRILKWGKVATVTNNDTLSAGTYYSGTTYQNMRKRSANGWDATTSWYSGPGYTNKVDYTLDGAAGTLKFRGLLYTNGVILADSRKPTRALCVSQFPYSVKPGPDGQFSGELSAWLWGGIIATLVVELTVVYLAVQTVLDQWVNR
jgi:hypothetical protein